MSNFEGNCTEGALPVDSGFGDPDFISR